MPQSIHFHRSADANYYFDTQTHRFQAELTSGHTTTDLGDVDAVVADLARTDAFKTSGKATLTKDLGDGASYEVQVLDLNRNGEFDAADGVRVSLTGNVGDCARGMNERNVDYSAASFVK